MTQLNLSYRVNSRNTEASASVLHNIRLYIKTFIYFEPQEKCDS